MGLRGFILGWEEFGFLGHIRIDRIMANLKIALKSYLDDILLSVAQDWVTFGDLVLSLFCPFVWNSFSLGSRGEE